MSHVAASSRDASPGAAQNQFDSIDLTDNAISRLEGFPKLHRLRTLLLSNNRVSRIAPNLEGVALVPPDAEATAMFSIARRSSRQYSRYRVATPTIEMVIVLETLNCLQ